MTIQKTLLPINVSSIARDYSLLLDVRPKPYVIPSSAVRLERSSFPATQRQSGDKTFEKKLPDKLLVLLGDIRKKFLQHFALTEAPLPRRQSRKTLPALQILPASRFSTPQQLPSSGGTKGHKRHRKLRERNRRLRRSWSR